MNDFFLYFSGINGNAVSGNVSVPFLVSKADSPVARGSLPFYYADGFFMNSACSYNHELALMSLGMTMAAFTQPDTLDKPVRSLLKSIGCAEKYIETKKFDTAAPTDDSCAYAFGIKRLPDGSFLVPVVIRSHKYGGEWVSNAHVFDEACPDFPVGFKNAADKVYDALTRYIDRSELKDRKIKIWVSGFSRGGAVANLLGARLTLESGISKDDVFVYTFASPNTVCDSAAVFTDNIFNIVSEMDVVPRVPPQSWGFVRYGTDLYLPCKTRRGEEEYGIRLDAMRQKFSEILTAVGLDGTEYAPLDSQEEALDLLFDYVDDLITDPVKYASDGYQSLIMDYMTGVVSGSKTEFKRFVYFMLRDNRSLADEFCSMLEHWNSMSGNEKAQKITFLNLKITGRVTKHMISEHSPAMDIISIALRILVHYAAKLTATRVTGGTQDFYYEQLVKLIVDAYQNGTGSTILMQHWSESYLAWLLSGSEHELYAVSSYTRTVLK